MQNGRSVPSARAAARAGLGALGALLLGACTARLAQEQYYPSPSWGTGRSGSDLRVRMNASGSECTLARVAGSHAVSNAVGAMVDGRVRQELAGHASQVAVRTAAAEATASELDAAVHQLEQNAASPASEAELLRLLNVVCAGLGAPAPFATAAQARAFLDHATASGGR